MEYLIDLSKSIATDLKTLLSEKGETALSEKISNIKIFARCKCEDDKCSSFWTSDIPAIPYNTNRYRQITLLGDDKCYCLDMVDDNIVYVEVVHSDNKFYTALVQKINIFR